MRREKWEIISLDAKKYIDYTNPIEASIHKIDKFWMERIVIFLSELERNIAEKYFDRCREKRKKIMKLRNNNQSVVIVQRRSKCSNLTELSH